MICFDITPGGVLQLRLREPWFLKANCAALLPRCFRPFREIVSKLPQLRWLGNKSGGKQEAMQVKANLTWTPVADRQVHAPFWEQTRWRGHSIDGSDLQDWLQALLDYAEG